MVHKNLSSGIFRSRDVIETTDRGADTGFTLLEWGGQRTAICGFDDIRRRPVSDERPMSATLIKPFVVSMTSSGFPRYRRERAANG